MEVNAAPPEILIRVPGIGFKSAYKIVKARKYATLTFSDLAKMRVVLKRAEHFITCGGKFLGNENPTIIKSSLLLEAALREPEQLSLFSTNEISSSILTGEL